jgi:hypothetical protein
MRTSHRATALAILALLILEQTVNPAEAATTTQLNRVTVSTRDGDYSDPIAAANNALQGDTWCVSPLPDRPCVIRILAGIYVLPQTLVIQPGVALVGAEKHQVLLIAGKGLPVAVASGGPSIANLSIVNDDPEGVALVFGGRLRGVSVQARRFALTNEFGEFRVPGGFDLANSEISADGMAVVVQTVDVVLPFRARNSRIIGGTRAMLVKRSGGFFLRDCEVAARSSDVSGGIIAIEIEVTELGVDITGGSIFAENTGGGASAGLSIALDLHDIDISSNVRMMNTQVFGGIQLDRDNAGFDTFDGVNIKARSEGIVSVAEGGNTRVLRSRIDAPVALDLRVESAQPVEINQSFLKGDVKLHQNPTKIKSSVLTGTLSGGEITCRNVYDANYLLHSSDCPTN